MTDKRATPLASKDQTKIIFDLLTEAKNVGRTVRGVNETTKMVNKGKAKLVIIAADSVPLEIVLHLPDLCEDKGVSFIFVDSRQALGRALGISRPAIAVAITTSGKKTGLDDKIEHVLHKLE
ncbi:Ribosomal_protein L7Ae [Hexamita inflata]|uniref:Ribosomal protein L7Ae n=1 Tax=Hexamita inflata TaxID=28002 RepID=A0AA86PUD3_9EUKA|nr:Ribosomal protein L7Ae [Hexamita inflata]CAI9945143.1 Ribosomal protein L7Ae [Hexamita inflata]